jgi:hypothetical protein
MASRPPPTSYSITLRRSPPLASALRFPACSIWSRGCPTPKQDERGPPTGIQLPSEDGHASELLPQIGYARPPSLKHLDNDHRTDSLVIENRLLHGECEERTLNWHNAALQEEDLTKPMGAIFLLHKHPTILQILAQQRHSPATLTRNSKNVSPKWTAKRVRN